MKRTVATLAVLFAAAVGLSAPPAQAAGTTTITLAISNCAGCTIQPTLLRTDADGTTVTYTGAKAKVRNGVAVMKVPTANTPGMSFLLDGPEPEDINALPVLVTQYAGFKPGSVVSPAQARAAKKASGCWIGTSSSRVTLKARAMTVRLPTFPADGTTTPVTTAWLVPTAKAVSGFDDTAKGVLATQNVGWPCDAG
jgi:hypothetical protein